MTHERIPRAPVKMDHDSFVELFSLNVNYPWLQSESEGMIELWNFCDEQEQRQLVSSLIRQFEVVDSNKLKMYGEQVASIISDTWNANPVRTRIVAVSDESHADGSQSFLQSLKNKFSVHDGWSEGCFINDLREAVNVAKDDWTIVLLDDFIGTGRTIKRKVGWFLDELAKDGKHNVSVKAVAIAGMEESKNCLDELEVECFCPVWLRKGISDHFDGDALDYSTKSMQSLENKLGAKFKGMYLPRFGYGRSEALFCVEAYNVPNNVFPIFWWPVTKDNSARSTIFKRLR